MSNPFEDINFAAIFFAALVGFALGWLWYSPFLFGKIWCEEAKVKEEDMKKKNKTILLASTFGLTLIAAFILSSFVEIAGASGALSGGIIGLLAGGGFVATAVATNYLFDVKSMKMFFINAGHHVACYVAMGTVLGMMS
ncbi:MAG: DUF1761 domain-containing protein [Candidatus Omnitrophica bacterium]|nr:DUF1761 domain-containing protein [Candidatus Omnitrophota bacterium]